MDVPTGHVVQQVVHLLRQGLVVPLHEEDPLVPEGAGPVRVHLELAPDVLGDDQLLGQVSLYEAEDVTPLLVRDNQLVPFLLLQPETFQSVVLDEIQPDNGN